MITQFTFKGGIEILRATDANQTVGVGQTGENTDIVTTFKLRSNSHDDLE